ncbi:MAG: GNAT family N-acetyltransferase [Bacteroidetes bacterium]|nr:GNAT family N-acetyltransferase [Bacteroidota bacterium]MBS1540285.1 GNAT family N-acetyltransferase [Bacteroidota bacterium]
MKITPLKHITQQSIDELGLNGYVTDKIYNVSITGQDTLSITLQKIERPYTKKWETTQEDISEYNSIIKTGHSFSISDRGAMLGLIICEHRVWNNTLYITTILVSEKYRKQGVGKRLIAAAIEHAQMLQCRLVELETQNTNVPAVDFYKKLGFKITGLNTKLYSDCRESALFMTYENRQA